MSSRGGYVSEDDIDAELFGEPDRGTIEYLRERVERYAPRIGQLFDGFFRDTRDAFESYNGERALRRIRSRVRRVSDPLRSDIIRPLTRIDDIQRAKPQMQRYLMANIVSRILAENQAIDGWSDQYSNPRPDRRGFDDPDYMRVIDGVIFDDDRFGITTRNDEDAWVAYQDLNELSAEDNRGLDVVEQGDILSTWDVLEALYAAKKKDPTSILNEAM